MANSSETRIHTKGESQCPTDSHTLLQICLKLFLFLKCYLHQRLENGQLYQHLRPPSSCIYNYSEIRSRKKTTRKKAQPILQNLAVTCPPGNWRPMRVYIYHLTFRLKVETQDIRQFKHWYVSQERNVTYWWEPIHFMQFATPPKNYPLSLAVFIGYIRSAPGVTFGA